MNGELVYNYFQISGADILTLLKAEKKWRVTLGNIAEMIVVDVAAKAVEGVISKTWMEIKCLLGYKRNIKKLKEKVKDLGDRRDTIKLLIDAAERNGEVIGPDVLGWMVRVGDIEKEANDVLARTTSAQFGCLYCRFPKLHSRYGISKDASSQTIEVTELQDVSKFERIGYPAAPGKMPFASPEDLDGFESRIRIRDGILEALRDNLITKIGLCGMGGVGKTTLVKEIADKVKAVKLFDEVSMAVVSKEINIAKIQDQIAENLGLKIEEKTIHQRAERLYGRLMNINKRILVILDDIWEELDFRMIGIPVEGDREGLKVLLTSRNMGVCTSMRALTFEVKVLSDSSVAGDTSALRSLKKLEILSFFCSSLEKFPREIEELVNLKSLDLRFKECPPIPTGMLKNLERLEELYLGCYIHGEENREEDVCCGFISEISSLLSLRTIQFCVEDDYHLERLLGSFDVERLLRFGITKLNGEKEVGEFQFIKCW